MLSSPALLHRCFLVSILFGTSIPTSSNISYENCFYTSFTAFFIVQMAIFTCMSPTPLYSSVLEPTPYMHAYEIPSLHREYINSLYTCTNIYMDTNFQILSFFCPSLPPSLPYLTLGVSKGSGFSPSSMTSKYRVSISEFSTGTTGASLLRIVSHDHTFVLKKRCRFTSSAPLRPSLTSLDREEVNTCT